MFAAGDVANHFHPLFGRRTRVEHWQNAIRQGRAAALNMLGRDVAYDEVHWFWSDQYDQNLQYVGHHLEWDELVVRGSLEKRRFVAFYRIQGRVAAAVGLNSGRDVRRSVPLVRSGVYVPASVLRDPDADLADMVPAG